MTKQISQINEKALDRTIIAAKICAWGNFILAILSPVFSLVG